MFIGLFLLMLMMPAYCNTNQSTAKVKLIRQKSFDPPIETHLIEIVPSVRSYMVCAAICDRHIVCRTADYHSITKDCRLFETLASAGTFVSDSNRVILALDYCPYGDEQESEYVCTRSGVYSVQEVLDRLNSTTTETLLSYSRTAFVNMHGVYVGNSSGSLLFSDFRGTRHVILNESSEVTNINAATRNGLIMVQYYTNESTLFVNNGTPWSPILVPTIQFPLLGQPLDCFVTSQYMYITYCDSRLLFTIYHRQNRSVLFSYNASTLSHRPSISQWKDKIIIMDQDEATEYDLNGSYLGNWTYPAPLNASERNDFHHDYAGRRYICNNLGSSPGIHVFLLNGTRLAVTSRACARAVQVYLTKEQAVSVAGSPSVMRVINF